MNLLFIKYRKKGAEERRKFSVLINLSLRKFHFIKYQNRMKNLKQNFIINKETKTNKIK